MNILQNLKKAAPTILAIVSSAGVIATAVLAVKATPKANDRILAAKSKKETEQEQKTFYADNEPYAFSDALPELTKKETILAAAPAYIPTIICGALTIGCIIGSNVLNKKAQASLASAYALVNHHYNQYRNAARDVYGEEGERKIREHIAISNNKDDIGSQPLPCCLTREEGENEAEKILFYEPYTEKYFWSTIERVQQAEYRVNRELQEVGGVSIGQFLEYLGLDVENDNLYMTGWCQDYLMCDCGVMWLDFYNIKQSPDGKVDENGKDIPPFYAIEYYWDPILDYEHWDEVPFL